MQGWIGFDLDGTLARYEHGEFRANHVGEPIGSVVKRLKTYLHRGYDVRIFTARVYPINACIEGSASDTHLAIWRKEHAKVVPLEMADRVEDAWAAVHAIRAWTLQHVGQTLSVTNIKDYSMIRLYDDRAIQVVSNEGTFVGE